MSIQMSDYFGEMAKHENQSPSITRVKSIYEYEYTVSPQQSQSTGRLNEFTGRNDEEALNLYKEYKDSIYVDRYYNSSFALNIPLFTVTLPGRGRGVHSPGPGSSSTLNIGSSIILSGMILGGIALFAPIIFPESRRSFERALDIESMNNFVNQQMDDFSEHVFGQKLNPKQRKSVFKTLEKQFSLLSTNIIHSMHESIKDLPHFPGKRLEECIKWSVCDSHKRLKKYGYLGRLFRSIFPHKSLDNNESEVLSNYLKPAKHGRDVSVDCDDIYDDCSLNIVETCIELKCNSLLKETQIVAKNAEYESSDGKQSHEIYRPQT
ncbi:uncharacterized protein LOC128961242 [Oppia nitens]|uniref:uncharacterized protein LOC128961242 n=1 Tax=Oppia nitens TaxID=1686743 RepID=UPI0023DB2FD3|nr:uncharacterized protein LOC128961242 [Oppia nitens]